jgi:hypothetical protein
LRHHDVNGKNGQYDFIEIPGGLAEIGKQSLEEEKDDQNRERMPPALVHRVGKEQRYNDPV